MISALMTSVGGEDALLTTGGTPQSVEVTIAIGTSLSPAVDLQNLGVRRIVMPAAWTAANLTFQISEDNVTFRNVFNDTGTEYAVTAAVDRAIIVDPGKIPFARWLKVRSGTAAVPVNQVAERVVTLLCRAG